MKCPKCHHENPEDAKFCQECGNRLIAASEAVRTSSIPDAERKRVTALFSDLSGYTAITEKLDPEEVKEITSRIFDGVKAIISKYEGFIERIAGDGLLALFGVPKAHEDDPIRAIHAAREIHALVDGISPQYVGRLDQALSMHTGINTGLAVTSEMNPERGSYGVTGDAINVAARLSDLATAGEILVGPDTHRATQNHFNFQPLKPAKVKGKSEPITIYKLLSEKTRDDGIRQKMQVSSEMVGRDQELAKLELHILKAVNGHGSVVNVFGEPGIGKSRLLAELRKRDVISRVSLLEGRSISIGKNLSFHPIIDLFKQWSKIQEDDTQAEASNKLETAIRRVCGDEADEMFPFVATMIGMKLIGKHSQRVESIEGEALEKLIFKNVRELLIRSTELIPIVIVMEDLHWADTTSLELLESVFRLAQTHRVVFINVFRPGYWEGDDRKIETLPEWLPEADFAEIALKPLDTQMGEILANNMLQVKGLPYTVKQRIVDRAGGNPFFIEEIVRSLIDEGAIVSTNGAFEVTEKIDHVVIPYTINDVLMARIDRLEEQTRDLIKVASVIGRSFFYRILKDVAASIEGVDERLSYLKDAEFIRDRMRMEELEYLFKHALAQEAAYESTLLQQRKGLHLKVAQSMEKIFRERLHEFYGMLAYHYSSGEDLDKAEEYFIKAGEEALKSSASNEALNYYRKGLGLYLKSYCGNANPDKVALFEKNIALAFFNKGKYENASKYFESVLALFETGPPNNKVLILIRLIVDLMSIFKNLYSPFKKLKKSPSKKDREILDMLYRNTVSLAYFNPKKGFIEHLNYHNRLSKFDTRKIEDGQARWMSMSAYFSFTGISFKLSRKVLDISKDIIDDTNIRELMEYSFYDTMHKFAEGNWSEIRKCDENILDLNLKNGTLWPVITHLLYYTQLIIEQGEFSNAEVLINKMANIGEVYEYETATAYHYWLKAKSLIKSRKINHAKASIDVALPFIIQIGMEGPVIYFYGSKAIVQVLLDDIDEAKESIFKGSRMVQRLSPVPPHYIHTHLMSQFLINLKLFENSALSNDYSKISKYRKNACKWGKKALRNSVKYASERTEVLRLMGNYHWLIGKQSKAIKWWNKAIKEGERLGARPDLSRTYFEIGKRFLEPQSKYKQLNGVDAQGYLEKARAMFEEMGLERDLDELDRINISDRSETSSGVI